LHAPLHPWQKAGAALLIVSDLSGDAMEVKIDILERPIKRIQEVCCLMGVEDKFDRALAELETFLESEVADGETRETVLTDNGFRFLRDRL
jgi:hypothetical protein